MRFRWQSLILARALAGFALASAAAALLPIEIACAQAPPHKKKIPVAQAAGPNSVSQDFGNIAVIVDNGLMVTSRNVFDLNGLTVQFTPVGLDTYSISNYPTTLDAAFGPALTFGYPAATLFPGDDDTQELPFAAGFPFYGTVYTGVWVNTDGNVTFGAPEFSSDDRDKSKHALGPPRVSAYLFDVNAFNAFNPAGTGTIHAAVKTGPDRLVVTWNEVADFQGGVSSTFQLTLYASGVVVIAIDHIDPAAAAGVTGLAQGGGQGPFTNVDLSGSTQIASGGAIMEAFVTYTQFSALQTAREFYKTHPDKFDFLITFVEFPVDTLFYSRGISNKTHGISTPLSPPNGAPDHPTTVFDDSAIWGSAGELEQVVFMGNLLEEYHPVDAVNPPVVPYDTSLNNFLADGAYGFPITLDGQTMAQVRRGSNILQDDGEFSRFFPSPTGVFYSWLVSPMSLMAQEVEHRWGMYLRFVHPTKGGDGFDSYDLLGRDIEHWSYFANSVVPPSQFGGAPRSTGMEGNVILDLGAIATYNGVPTNLAPGEHVFVTPSDALQDGFNELDQYIMGLRQASEVGAFWYVDEPKSIYTGQSLDVFNPANPLSTTDTMRGWLPQGGIVFKGKRVDLTLQNIKDSEKTREKGDNPQGKRIWGPKNNLTVHYFSNTRQVDPNGDASIVLSAADRALGDEADMIDLNDKPVDVKTMAFILVVKSGDPSSHMPAINRLDAFRQTWEAYGNGLASGGRGKFDTRLDPPIY